MAGRVESVGRDVTHFQAGDEVFGETIKGYQWTNGGAYAEHVSVPEDSLALKPANITFDQAAAVPTAGLIALQNLPNEGRLHPGQSVSVNGAGGGVGTLAVELAKAYGANVTGVDDTAKLDMVRSIGADQVIDYTKEDFTQSGERYDLIFDIPGTIRFRLVDASSLPMENTCSSDTIASGREPDAGSEASPASSIWSRSLRSCASCRPRTSQYQTRKTRWQF